MLRESFQCHREMKWPWRGIRKTELAIAVGLRFLTLGLPFARKFYLGSGNCHAGLIDNSSADLRSRLQSTRVLLICCALFSLLRARCRLRSSGGLARQCRHSGQQEAKRQRNQTARAKYPSLHIFDPEILE